MTPPSVRISTALDIAASPSTIWSRLCDAQMPATTPCEFRLGVFSPPRPLACELPTGVGGVGATRRCVSDRGTVIQRITAWSVDERLAFELVSEDAGLGAHVREMRDVFELTSLPGGATRLTRTTELVPAGPCPRLRGLALSLALRRVHRFTMLGFKSVAEAD
jgi:hypothetical protein